MSLNPITREEKFLAKAGGEDVGELKPITRREKFLAKIADASSGGGSSGGSGGSGGSNKFVLLHNETIVLTEPVKLITKKLQVPATDMGEFIAIVEWTANENTETSGNDTLYLRLADCQSELGDGTKRTYCLTHLIPLGGRGELTNSKQTYYESVARRENVALSSNATQPLTRYAGTANFVSFDSFVIAVNNLAYQGTILIQILGR